MDSKQVIEVPNQYIYSNFQVTRSGFSVTRERNPAVHITGAQQLLLNTFYPKTSVEKELFCNLFNRLGVQK